MNPTAKTCKSCHEAKQPEEFHKLKANKDGLHNVCKECRRKVERERSAAKRRDPAYRERDRVRSLEYSRARREADPEAYNEYQRQWRAANPGKSAAYTRKSYYKHHEKSLARARERYAVNPGYFAEWQRANPDKVRGYQRKWRAVNPGYQAEWRASNPGKAASATSKWRAAHPERLSAWRKANPDKVREYNARRYAATSGTTVDYAAIYAAHDVCYLCGGTLVNPVHMDHVIPLARGGAHSVGNLLPAHARCNLRKHDALLSELDWYRGPVDLGATSATDE